MANEPNPPLDMAIINQLSAMLEDGIYELFEEYLGSTARLLKELEVAVRQQDSEAVRRLAHSLKGSSGNLGITHVYTLSEALEQEAGTREGSETAYAKLAEIEQAFTRAHEALSALMPEKP